MTPSAPYTNVTALMRKMVMMIAQSDDTGTRRQYQGGSRAVGSDSGGGGVRQQGTDGPRRTTSQPGRTAARPRPQPGTNFGLSVPRYSIARHRPPAPQPGQTAWPYAGRQVPG